MLIDMVAYFTHIYDVVKLQNKAIRVINDVPIMENIIPHYVNLGILKFPDIVKLHPCLCLLYTSPSPRDA